MGLGIRGDEVESDLSQLRRTTPGRSSGALWSSCSRDTDRSPWPDARLVTTPHSRLRSALPPGKAKPYDVAALRVLLRPSSCREGRLCLEVWLESTRGSCVRVCCAAQPR
jgi:hypothetical protein